MNAQDRRDLDTALRQVADLRVQVRSLTAVVEMLMELEKHRQEKEVRMVHGLAR